MEKTEKMIERQNTAISVFSGAVSAIYQYNLLIASPSKVSNRKIILYCTANAILSYMIASTLLKQMKFIVDK
jgi:hypothetical protein